MLWVFLHPSMLVFIPVLLVTVFFAASAQSWFFAWIALEVNLFCFLPLILFMGNKYSTEATIKYFLVQTIASIILFISTIVGQPWMTMGSSWFTLSALMFKMGSAPFHQWLISIADALNWHSSFLLMTVQKLAPLALVTNFSFNDEMQTLLGFSIISAIVGSVGGLLQSSLRKIMMFSSISHLSWVIAAMMISQTLWMMYFMVYSIMVCMLLSSFNSLQVAKLSDLMNSSLSPSMKLIISSSFLSMSGLPPLLGFLPKLIVLDQLILKSMIFLSLSLVLFALVSMFFYVRMGLSMLSLSLKYAIWSTMKPWRNTPLLILNVTLLLAPSILYFLC
uniref:NADH-ubiquinone oxidoreductase chain 2 n=1 Tax=Stygobromus foliatus TaxID=1678291 RepID=A0A172QHE8_9CRUS|nr:NADH dehydrogenase subunit 2 [Stygobromus foliatus]